VTSVVLTACMMASHCFLHKLYQVWVVLMVMSLMVIKIVIEVCKWLRAFHVASAVHHTTCMDARLLLLHKLRPVLLAFKVEVLMVIKVVIEF